MIMGAGKTTCIAPLLAMMLADGASLVMQVVPTPLLNMSRNVMWSRFIGAVRKPVLSFEFGRSTALPPGLLVKLRRARRQGGIIMTTPVAIK